MEPGRLIMLKENVIYTQLMVVVDNLENRKLIQTGYLDMCVLIVGQQREILIAHVQLRKEQLYRRPHMELVGNLPYMLHLL